LDISKTASKHDISGLERNFFQESEKIVDKISVDALEAVFQEQINRWADALQPCGKSKVREMKETRVH
jgi:hypothetical protein